MPTVTVNIDNFNKKLGKNLDFNDLENLCFDFGIEVEKREVTKKNKKTNQDEVTLEYAFEVGANRPDLLSVETLSLALGTFIGTRKMPKYTIKNVKNREKIIVKENCKKIREFVVGCVLRNVTFDQYTYDSFIDFQDKLHHNLCRRRRLASMGTHDLDTIKGPFIYDAKTPKSISFVPLDKTEEMDGEKLMEFYDKDIHLKEFLPIIRDSDVYPVFLDHNNVVMSLPPIINSDHSKIKLTTKNVFVEITATDYTRAVASLNCIVAAFSQYCAEPFTIEEVEIFYEAENRTDITPKIENLYFETSIEYINCVGSLNLNAQQACELLNKMCLNSQPIQNSGKIKVEVPITRSDILQECDIVEDVCIAFGYNNIDCKLPKTPTVGKQLFLNKMSDLVREEMASAGYKEGLNFVLVSDEDLTSKLLKKNDGQMVIIDNPKVKEFNVGRTTLIPGCLKWLCNNRQNKIPIKMFEVGDVVLQDKTQETGTRNERRMCALYTNLQSQIEIIHGLVDYIMMKLNVKLLCPENSNFKRLYKLIPANEDSYFRDKQAYILFNDVKIGILGVLHPLVLQNYQWKYPVSVVEINLEPLFKEF
ncbi:phenylalanyl-tRNA synthetase beta chain, putative [Ichthyophthirius multifiliis]|uniref:phenylalanine--tRNA ligase n=1 Tax=Ichthyophthirius multifiliis TaxID=5932 RepID=G0R425_ICHMU|nr:phenylalanyl-tRNA synthetase beta chain, putative [Ichthyophthirius multifiliis]EGR27777.1 phenylalanyl-tRNA synthetase beta chain, putative [Ichthyophthirius multifiliis]|eukprot:XP_004026844.1 phenylalanyl-tRNA synthetase beta chain, putative [Ichthyophthirius multifiliis]